MAASSALSCSLHASFRLQPSAKSGTILAGVRPSPSSLGFQGSLSSSYTKPCYWNSSVNSNRISRHSPLSISCSMNMAAGKSDDDNKRISFRHLVNKAREVWESCPEPMKSFPWSKARDNFIQLQLDLIIFVVKYLSIPLLLVTTLSELSYCAHQRKLFFAAIPLLIGFVVAGFLRETALEMSSRLKNAEVPWHLLTIATLFALIKLPGPSYPYWARLFVPHLANGVLWRTAWFTFQWFRRPRDASGELISSQGH